MSDEVKISESSAPTKSAIKTLAEEQIQADIDIAGGVASY